MTLRIYVSNHGDEQHVRDAKRNAANGLAGLDASIEIPLSLLKVDVANGLAGLDASVEIPLSLLKVNVANGLAGLDASVEIPVSLLKVDVANGIAGLDASERLSVNQGGVPSGLISMWHGLIVDIPTGWVLCDGTNSTPDLRASFVRGAPTTTEAGSTGGADTHTLSVTETPSHRHTIYGGGLTGGSNYFNDSSNIAGNVAQYSEYVGGGGAHNNMPTYYEILFIMKS